MFATKNRILCLFMEAFEIDRTFESSDSTRQINIYIEENRMLILKKKKKGER